MRPDAPVEVGFAVEDPLQAKKIDAIQFLKCSPDSLPNLTVEIPVVFETRCNAVEKRVDDRIVKSILIVFARDRCGFRFNTFRIWPWMDASNISGPSRPGHRRLC